MIECASKQEWKQVTTKAEVELGMKWQLPWLQRTNDGTDKKTKQRMTNGDEKDEKDANNTDDKEKKEAKGERAKEERGKGEDKEKGAGGGWAQRSAQTYTYGRGCRRGSRGG